MSSDVPTQEFHIRDLKTRAVTLYPQRAHVVRELTAVAVQPGHNKIVITGLTPTVDEHSIKVDGTGLGRITDLSVEYLPNKELFADIYPSDDEDEDDDEDDGEDDGETPKSDPVQLVNTKIANAQQDLDRRTEELLSAEDQLNLLKHQANDMKELDPDSLNKCLEIYRMQRVTIYEQYRIAKTQRENLVEDIKKLEEEKKKLLRPAEKAKQKAEKAKAKLREKKEREQQKRQKEKERIQKERVKFWPKMTYSLTISVELPTFTPMSSRRNSIDTLVAPVPPQQKSAELEKGEALQPEPSSEVTLSVSYITWGASWSPRYDLSLVTSSRSGVLEYSAELVNTTSETWTDAKVILSTSQTSFEGLDEQIPLLVPWYLRLSKGGYYKGIEPIKFSSRELESKEAKKTSAQTQALKPRSEMFGVDGMAYIQAQQYGAVPGSAAFGASSAPPMVSQQAQWRQQPQMISLAPELKRSMPAPAPPAALPRIGSSLMMKRRSAAPDQGGLMQQIRSRGEGSADELAGGGGSYGDESSNEDEVPSLTHDEGAWEETGLTTTYELPGVKTMKPSSTRSKHKIARINFSSIIFSHIVVPKLRTAAFLKARIRNSSKITLLKGTMGLTLDGSFLGQSQLPRCTAGESFSLSLGVDPTINVNYLKPEVHHSTSGMFNKEDSYAFKRTVLLTNTKHDVAVEMTVLDQVPRSQDERLRIDIISPKGLRLDGGAIATGTAITNAFNGSEPSSAAATARSSVYGAPTGTATKTKPWGTALASLLKEGEVKWNVMLNPASSCKLTLEYDYAHPVAEAVVNGN